MASITLGEIIHTSGVLPVGTQLADFTLVQTDLSVASLAISKERK
jgi:peroxiredoxin